MVLMLLNGVALMLDTAALEDRRISADDLKLAVKLAIAPRGIFMQNPPDDEEMMVRYMYTYILDQYGVMPYKF